MLHVPHEPKSWRRMEGNPETLREVVPENDCFAKTLGAKTLCRKINFTS